MSASPLSMKAAWASIRALPGSVMKPIFLLVIVLSAIATLGNSFAVRSLLTEQAPSPFLIGMYFLAASFLLMLSTYVIHRLIAAHDRGESPSLAFLLDGFLLRYVVPIIIIYAALAVAGAIATLPIGSMPLSKASPPAFWLIPLIFVLVGVAFYISLRLTCILPVITFEDTSLFKAIGRSWRITHGQFWPIFRVCLVIALLFVLIFFVVAVVTSSLGMSLERTAQPTTLNYILDFTFNVIAYTLTMLLGPAIYRVLRDGETAEAAQA